MKTCLAHPTDGYYMKGDVFGTKGDFTTSPEISQTFGEIVALWFASQWMARGASLPIRFVEIGPGRGTLTADIIRVSEMLQMMRAIPVSAHLVENSERLREVQASNLQSLQSHPGQTDISWHEDLSEIPLSGDPAYTMVIAHELFDALPIHILDRSEAGFSEVLIGLKESPSESAQPPSTPFRFVKSPISSPSAQLLAASSPRFQNGATPGRIEVSPEGFKTARAIGELIAKPGQGGGAGLIIDYGDDHYQVDSFRAFHKHKPADVFNLPGMCDLTASVDFAYLREALAGINSGSSSDMGVRALGPISQQQFLLSLGLELRAKKLADAATSDERKAIITEGAQRLVNPVGMGRQYKIMGIVPERRKAVGGEGSEQQKDESIYPFEL
ncbi:DUF185-domain-containing protein [Clavulina sp. PMI_390]|nr:DUF185-domain-containing protein [Clavulina sp. PMI_390]